MYVYYLYECESENIHSQSEDEAEESAAEPLRRRAPLSVFSNDFLEFSKVSSGFLGVSPGLSHFLEFSELAQVFVRDNERVSLSFLIVLVHSTVQVPPESTYSMFLSAQVAAEHTGAMCSSGQVAPARLLLCPLLCCIPPL